MVVSNLIESSMEMDEKNNNMTVYEARFFKMSLYPHSDYSHSCSKKWNKHNKLQFHQNGKYILHKNGLSGSVEKDREASER
jgi:hypothetical protein